MARLSTVGLRLTSLQRLAGVVSAGHSLVRASPSALSLLEVLTGARWHHCPDVRGHRACFHRLIYHEIVSAKIFAHVFWVVFLQF